MLDARDFVGRGGKAIDVGKTERETNHLLGENLVCGDVNFTVIGLVDRDTGDQATGADIRRGMQYPVECP